ERLWGVGRVTSGKLRARGITTVGELAAVPEGAVVAMLGRAAGRHLHALSHHRDPRRVEVGRRRRSMGAQRALGWRRRECGEVEVSLLGLVARVPARMRAAGVGGRTVIVRFRFEDLPRATRSHTLPMATAETRHVVDAARGLLFAERTLIEHAGLTLVGVSV